MHPITRSRPLQVLVLALTVALAATSCGGDDDDSGDDTTTTVADDSTTSATPADESTTTATTEEETTEEGATDAGEVTLADFEGSWQASSFVVTSQDDPTLTLDLVALGATVTAETDANGQLAGQLIAPEALGGGIEAEFAATFEIVDAQTMTVTFDPEVPPLLTSFTGPFTLEGDTMALLDEGASFDFADGAGLVPVTAEVVLVRV